MKLGVHLPQAGGQASPDRILRHAMRAEALGLSDVWVSEHIIVPKDAAYPPTPIFYDPVVVLSWVAAVTRRVRLGASQELSAGWLKAYEALGVGHVLVEPNDREVDDLDRILEGVGRVAGG